MNQRELIDKSSPVKETDNTWHWQEQDRITRLPFQWLNTAATYILVGVSLHVRITFNRIPVLYPDMSAPFTRCQSMFTSRKDVWVEQHWFALVFYMVKNLPKILNRPKEIHVQNLKITVRCDNEFSAKNKWMYFEWAKVTVYLSMCIFCFIVFCKRIVGFNLKMTIMLSRT